MNQRNMKKNRVMAEQPSISDNFKVKKSLGVADFNFDTIENSIPPIKKAEVISGLASKLTAESTKKLIKPAQGQTLILNTEIEKKAKQLYSKTKQNASVGKKPSPAAQKLLGRYGFEKIETSSNPSDKSQVSQRANRSKVRQSKKRSISKITPDDTPEKEVKLSKRRKSKELTNDAMVKINGNKGSKGQINIGAAKLKTNLQGNLSSSTVDILKKLKQQQSDAPLLNQNVKIDEFTSEESQKQSSESGPPKFSAATQALINEIQRESKSNGSAQKVFRGTSNHGLSMSEKHKDLLNVTRKLVMPAQYRALIQMSKFIDTALNFLKNRKMNAGSTITSKNKMTSNVGQTFISFQAVKESVAMTQAKTLSLKQFRQILTIAPDFYDQKWQKGNNQRSTEPMLMINLSNGLNTVNIFEQQKRENLLESRFIDHTIITYDQFISKLKETEEVLPLYLEPKKYQMWHSKFDPHSDQIPELVQASLDQIPTHLNSHKSTSVQDFLSNNNQKRTLISDALTHVARNSSNSPSKKKDSESKQKLTALSAKTGLSESTLRLIQKKQEAGREALNQSNASISIDTYQKRKLEFQKLSEQVRNLFVQKQKGSILLTDMIKGIVSNMSSQGQFMNSSQINQDLFKLSKLVPEYMEIKEVTLQGRKQRMCKIVNRNQPLSTFIVNKHIEDRLEK